MKVVFCGLEYLYLYVIMSDVSVCQSSVTLLINVIVKFGFLKRVSKKQS